MLWESRCCGHTVNQKKGLCSRAWEGSTSYNPSQATARMTTLHSHSLSVCPICQSLSLSHSLTLSLSHSLTLSLSHSLTLSLSHSLTLSHSLSLSLSLSLSSGLPLSLGWVYLSLALALPLHLVPQLTLAAARAMSGIKLQSKPYIQTLEHLHQPSSASPPSALLVLAGCRQVPGHCPGQQQGPRPGSHGKPCRTGSASLVSASSVRVGSELKGERRWVSTSSSEYGCFLIDAFLAPCHHGDAEGECPHRVRQLGLFWPGSEAG